jgi:molybdopterin biosynthesis enzyme
LAAGRRLQRADLAALALAGIGHIVAHTARVRIAPPAGSGDAVIDAVTGLMAAAVASAGGTATAPDLLHGGDPLVSALQDDGVDAVIGVGGTGHGADDDSVGTLAAMGTVEAHGIAIRPGETAALGFVGMRPVLLVPGRLDAAISVWLLIGRPLLGRLCGHDMTEPTATAELARKVVSPLGLTEVVPVRRAGDKVEPIASGYMPLHALTAADGWVLVPPDSEGYQAGARVVVRPFP